MAAVDTSANVENQENKPMNKEPLKNGTDKATSANTDKKEAETTTESTAVSSTTSTKAEAEEDKKTEVELLSEGSKLIADKDFYSASDVLSDALQIIQQKNIANSIESVPYYMAYGEALLRLIQSSNDLFAAPAAPQEQEAQEPEAPQLVQENTENSDKVQQDAAKRNAKAEQEDEDDDLAQNEAAKEAETGKAAVDTSEDREIAWETLEYARSIMEEYMLSNKEDTAYISKLALVHSMLGEILIEDENNEQALQEFECALDLHNKSKDGKTEYRQKAFDRFMACLAAQFCGKDDEALKHCNIALQELSQRIVGILKELKCDEERKENEYEALVSVAHDVLNKMEQDQKSTESAKELKQLVDSMEDLMAKVDEVKSVIEQKKNVQDNSEKKEEIEDKDPLSRLIKGLTSKFGIDEAQLAEMEQADKKEENKNKNKKEVSNGVTTIGFGTGATNDDDDDEVNELGSFGTKKPNERKKRSLEEAGIELDDGLQTNVKKMKLNSGGAAASAETEATK